jgi:hypothetical protein
MSNSRRFALDEKRYVIDAVNPANSGKAAPFFEGDPEDDKHLRESVLMVRLSELVKKLIINLRPREKAPWGEEEYEPRNEEADSISTALFYTIKASHLNTFEPTMSIQHKFDGKPRRQKKHTQDFTSLSLFRDEVECLLRVTYTATLKARDWTVLYGPFSILLKSSRNMCARILRKNVTTPGALTTRLGSVCKKEIAFKART